MLLFRAVGFTREILAGTVWMVVYAVVCTAENGGVCSEKVSVIATAVKRLAVKRKVSVVRIFPDTAEVYP